MSSLERDYLARLTRDLAQLASRLLGLRRPEDDTVVREELKAAAIQWTGFDLELLLSTPAATLQGLLDPIQRRAAQVVLQHEADRAQRAGDADRAARALAQAQALPDE